MHGMGKKKKIVIPRVNFITEFLCYFDNSQDCRKYASTLAATSNKTAFSPRGVFMRLLKFVI